MKKRRILSVLLCLALVVFSLSGCNKTSSKKSTSSKKADSGTLQGMIATHIYYERQGKKVDDFSDAEADNYIELNGIKSELVIVEAEV